MPFDYILFVQKKANFKINLWYRKLGINKLIGQINNLSVKKLGALQFL